jgi:hypothetical protein
MHGCLCPITPVPKSSKYYSNQCSLNSQRGQICFCKFEELTLVLPQFMFWDEHSLYHCIQIDLRTQHYFIHNY